MDKAKGAGYPSLEAMQQRVQGLYREDEKNSFYPVQIELTKAHLLWDRDDIIERYGAPESCWPDNLGLALNYKGPELAQTKITIKFIINNGFLIEVHLMMN